MNNTYINYLIIATQILLTILLINHLARGLNVLPILLLWSVMWALSISPILDIVYGNLYCKCGNLIEEDMLTIDFPSTKDIICERCFDREVIKYDAEEYAKSIDQSDYTPHKEEMEEEYQPNE